MNKSPANYSLTLEKRDVWVDGKCKTIRIAPQIWTRFLELCATRNIARNELARVAQREHNGSLAQAIEAYVIKHSDTPIYLHATREAWLVQALAALRAEFKHRGYSLPAKIRASVGFTGKGYRGKAIGQCWPAESSADAHVEIFLDPSKIKTALELLNVLTHELVHAWQDGEGKKLTHGRDFKACGEAMDLEGKPAHMLGKDAWEMWARPIVEALGPCPYGKLAEFMAKAKKQTTRMLKCECPECDLVWRTARTGLVNILDKGGNMIRCIDPGCNGRLHISDILGEEPDEEGEEPDEEGEEEAQERHDKHDYPDRKRGRVD